MVNDVRVILVVGGGMSGSVCEISGDAYRCGVNGGRSQNPHSTANRKRSRQGEDIVVSAGNQQETENMKSSLNHDRGRW